MTTMFKAYTDVGNDGYPPEWHKKIKYEVRKLAGFRCVRCGHPYRGGEHGAGEWSLCAPTCLHQGPVIIIDPYAATVKAFENEIPDGFGGNAIAGEIVLPPGPLVLAKWRILTVHHLDGDKKNCRWWNLAALCQRCHLSIQGRVRMNQIYPSEHSAWMKPYAAGFYAYSYLNEDLTRKETEARLDELLALERAV